MHNLEPSELVTQASKLDCLYWESVLEEQAKAREVFPDRAGAVVGNDLFNALYHYEPKLRPDAPEPARARALDQIMQSSDWMALHNATMGDETLAAAGAVTLRDKLAAQPETEKVAEDLESLERLRQALEGLPEGETGENGEKVEALRQELSAQQQEAQARVEQALGNKAIEKSIRQAMKQAGQDVRNAQEMAGGWGQDPGTVQDLLFNPETSRHLSQPKIRKILELAGRMRDVISAERSKRPRPGPQRVKVAVGNDLSRVMPQELAMLGDPELEDLFFRRYAENGLLLYEREEKPRLGAGPFVVCVDESGSMKGVREEWAKALAFALCVQAHKEKRKFGAIGFGSEREIREVFDPDPAALAGWMAHFFDGGTDFEAPLDHAKVMLEGSALKDADVVFITDGECQVTPEWLERFLKAKKEMGFKVLAVQIGTDSLMSLRQFADSVFRLNVNMGVQGLEAVIQEIK